MIDKNGLQCGNNGRATHHWTIEDHEGKSVIAVTLGNCPITEWSIPANNHTTGSDNKVTEWKVEADRLEDISRM